MAGLCYAHLKRPVCPDGAEPEVLIDGGEDYSSAQLPKVRG